jgi:hypothetical protein
MSGCTSIAPQDGSDVRGHAGEQVARPGFQVDDYTEPIGSEISMTS